MSYIVFSVEGKKHTATLKEACLPLLFMLNVSCPVSLYMLHRKGREGLLGTFLGLFS